MSALLFTLLLSAASWRLPGLPLFSQPIYLSAREPRAEAAFDLKRKVIPPKKIDIRSLGPRLSAQSALAVDKSSGAVLYDYHSQDRRVLASLTKLMTALTFLAANPDLSQKVVMTAADDRPGGQTFIRPGESAVLEAYLQASLIGSANNATMVLSRSAGKSAAEFVSAMNRQAAALGLTQTSFAGPTGLEAENVSTARDIVRLLQAASENNLIRELTTTWQDTIAVYPGGEERKIINTDHLLNSIVEIELGKTGYLEEALYNLAAIVKLKNGREIYAVVLGANSSEERFQDMKNLAIWAGNAYEWK